MQDQPTQRAVLGLALEAHPKSLTVPAIARQLGARDAIERAIAQLVEVGLLDRDGDAISASAAAVHFDRLELP
jgi:DNA-binding IclR family transcriptional regulator